MIGLARASQTRSSSSSSRRSWFFPLFPWFPLLLIQHLSAQSDIPCSLSTGTSRESFTANELLPVGSVIGVLNIIGDPSENGTIELRLSQDDAAVEIVPGTKNLTLVKKLDKEGIDGPAEVSLQVYCRKKDSTELSFPVPLRVYVSDANDNSPEFVNVPDRLEVSEMTQPGTVVTPQPIRAVDKDQAGPFSTVQYSLVPGEYSDHFTFTNALKGILALKSRLDYETVPRFNITIRAQDLANPPMSALVTIPVFVLDADDLNPKFADERYTSVLPENPEVGFALEIKPRPIKAQDMDKGLNIPIEYSFKSEKVDGKYFSIDSLTGVVTLRQTLPEDIVYPLTLVIKASQMDNRERTALTTLTVSERTTFLTGLRFLQTDYIVSVPENLPLNQTVLVLQTNKLNDKRLRFSLQNDTDNTFYISNKGDLLLQKRLDYESTKHYSIQVDVSDGKLSDSARVNVTVMDINNHSPEFGSQLYNFVVLDGILFPGMMLGQVDAVDGDSSDIITFHLVGDAASDFSIDDTGVIRVSNSSRQLNSSLTHLLVVATDNGQPPRHTAVPVLITFPDEARLSAARAFNADSSFLLMIVFGAMLGLLILIIIVLALYIAKHKHNHDSVSYGRTSSQSLSKVASYMSSDIPHQKLLRGSPPSDPRGQVGMDNPIFTEDSETIVPCTPSVVSKDDRPPSTLTASTTISPRPSPPITKKGAPPPLPRIDPSSTRKQSNGSGKGKAPIPSGSKPRKGSIPRRVKKLSWEDEKLAQTELDPEVSVTPLSSSSTSSKDSAETSIFL